MAQKGGRDGPGRDTRERQATGEPTHALVFFPSESGVENDRFFIGANDEDIGIKRDPFRWIAAFAFEDFSHGWAVVFRMHHGDPFLNGEVGVGDGPGLGLTDAEFIEVRRPVEERGQVRLVLLRFPDPTRGR